MRRTFWLFTVLTLALGAAPRVSESPGTAQLVKDIWPGPDGSTLTDVTLVGDTLYFVADDGAHGLELWRSDGTESGTTMVKDIWPGAEGSGYSGLDGYPPFKYWFESSYELTDVDGILYLAAVSPDASPSPTPTSTGTPGPTVSPSTPPPLPPRPSADLWRSDGTAEGTVMVKEGIEPACLTAFGGDLFFIARDDAHGVELWRSDGTEAGTVMVMDIRPGPDSSSPGPLTALGDTLFFSPDDGSHGHELWKTDGTESGTRLVKDINRLRSSRLDELTPIGGILYFSVGTARYGRELWRSDGTRRGTFMVRDINPGPSPSFPTHLTDVGGRLFFWAPGGLWRSDGTESGTVKVSPVGVGPSDPDAYWPLSSSVAAVGGTLYFTYEDGKNGLELWRSDGTRRGTAMVKDIDPGRADSVPYWLTDVGGIAYFFAFKDDLVSLWRSDGTADGTLVVAGPFPWLTFPEIDTPPPRWITAREGALFFAAATESTGYELWATDISPPGSGRSRYERSPHNTRGWG